MKKKPRIVLISTSASTITSFMLNNIKILSLDYSLIIICNDAVLLKKLVPKKIKLININFKRRPNLFVDISSFFILLYFFLKNKPDLSISISPKAGFITALSSLIARVSFRIHWFTGQIWVTKKGFSRSLYKFLDKLIFNCSNHVLVDSKSQKDFLIANNIITKNKATVLLHGSVGGVNIKKFKYRKSNRYLLRKKLNLSKNDFIFLYLGRINKDKGVDDLINAYQKIEKLHKAFLILVGPIEENYIKEKIEKNKKIIYVGETQEPQKWFPVADILCLPSYREGFGSVIIEAASCNIPALGSDIYGITDAIKENDTGFFHKVGNIRDLKNKMLFVLKNKKILKVYGKRARKRVEKKYEENLFGQKFLEFINLKINHMKEIN